MPTPALTTEQMKEAVEAYKAHGSQSAAAHDLGLPLSTYRSRLNAAKLAGFPIPKPKAPEPHGRILIELDSGIVIVFGDCHYWPGAPSTAHRALVRFAQKLKPKLVICHGDAFDGVRVSRHAPMTWWDDGPEVLQELEVCKERLGEIKYASKRARHIWCLGNHDQRFEATLASKVPEFRGVQGVSLKDHFPGWEPCWDVQINHDKGHRAVAIKHRLSGGVHATYNNAVKSGRNIVTGHLHSAKVTPVTDYNEGSRYGVDTGCIADPNHMAFGYTENNPKNWISGFAVLTFADGKLLMPELVTVVDPDTVQFRGELITV